MMADSEYLGLLLEEKQRDLRIARAWGLICGFGYGLAAAFAFFIILIAHA